MIPAPSSKHKLVPPKKKRNDVMLNLWITNISDTEEPENNSTSNFDDSSLSPIRVEDWDTDIVDNPTTEEYHLYPGSTPPVTNFPDGALLSPGALSSAPVVSTEGGSSEFPAPDSMPSARFFYSNPPSSVSNRRNSENSIQGSNPHPHPPHSSHRRPQIHVQVNLPGSSNPSSSAVQHQNYAHEPVQNSMPGMNPVPMAGNQCVDSRVMNSPSNGHYYSGMQRPDIPMLFHGSSYADNPMMSPSSKSAHGTAEAGEGSFYSAFQPEVDFLEFQSMYFHLCKFYHKYGHANTCKHGDYFVLGSWVEKLRQRKHIQDLQESGISVAASLNPISKRQSQLLESLGFRWHISASENAMIIQHMNFVDNAHARQVQSESQIEKPCPGTARTHNLTVTKPEYVKPPQQSSQLRNQKPGMTVPSNASLDANSSATSLPHHRPKGFQKQQTLIAPKTEVTPSLTKTEVPVVKKKRRKSAKDHANVSLARMQQQAENIKACEGIIAKHDNSFKEASQTKDKNKRSKSELQAPKILIDPNVDTAEHLWKCQFAKLSEYKRIHGDCTVPARFSEDPKLGHWVMTQRRQFNLMKKGKPSSMTVERMKLLNDIGFSWSIRIDPEKMWNLRYEQLQQYQANYGDCLVPQRFSENPKLGTWVNTQRRHFKLMNEGKSSCMNEERVKLLEKIKFVWSTSIIIGSTGMKNENKEGKISCENSGNKVDVINPNDAEGKTGIESGNFDESREVGEGLSTLSAAANVIAAMHYDGGNFYDEGEDEKSKN